MNACNINYDKQSYSALATDLKLLYNQINRPGIEGRIIKTLLFKYTQKDGENRKLLLTNSADLDETSREFISDVNNIICGLANASLDNLPEKAGKFRNIVLSTFFDMNNVGGVTAQTSSESQQETDSLKEIRTIGKIEDTLIDVYGIINTGLISDLTNTFGKELKQLLIYNDALKVKYELSTLEVNQKILDYKQSKFNNILIKLRLVYPEDKTLLTSMYSNGMLNSSLYYYVLNLFKTYINSDPDRNLKLNKQLENKILQVDKTLQESLYKELIDIITKDVKLNTWFNNKYKSNHLNSEARTLLFLINRFSSYYTTIKSKLLKEANRGAVYGEKVRNIIHNIENPLNDDLNYINDYIILSQFDDLLAQKLGDNVSISKGFIKNIEPQRQDALKYIIKKSKKHQSAGWETLSNTGSELHTSSNVKDILDTLAIYKYNETHQALPQTINMTSLMEAWQSLMSDILKNNIKFNSENSTAVITLLKNLINGLDIDALNNINLILEVLFSPKSRMIERMRNEILLTEQHKNILYSFYNQVLDKSNPESIISAELSRINDNLKYSTDFLGISSDLLAVLYRNVNNNFMEINLLNAKAAFTVKSKFNWDADLFDLVERITFKSKMRLNNKLGSDRLLRYNYNSESNKFGKFVSTVELKGKLDKMYTFGFQYNQGINNMEGLFSTLDTLTGEFTMLDNKNILDLLADIDLLQFKNKVLTNKELLNEHETVLSNFLEMLDYYLDTNLLSDKGLDTLQLYKRLYKSDPRNGLFSKNYLNHFLKIALRIADIDSQVENDVTEDSKYNNLFKRESKKAQSNIFDILANKVYFKPVTTKDTALSNLAKCDSITSGKATKSTSFSKSGTSVSNYSISRQGSELNRRLHKLKQYGGPASSLIFVSNPDVLEVDPILDTEITTPIGDVKNVSDMSSAELFQHSILDKFYLAFTKTGKICFLPTVYSDKTSFLNYLSSLTMFSDNIMDLTVDSSSEFIETYRNTFFAAHNKIQANIVIKLEKLMNFLDSPAGTKYKLDNDIFQSNRLDNTRTFLRNRSSEELMDLVYEYNKYNAEKIELELDKDYRDRKGFCDLNEIIDFYANLFNDPSKLKLYLQQLKNLFLEDLREHSVSFKLFNSIGDLNSWINNSLNARSSNNLVSILSNTKLLNIKDRESFVNKWVDKTTGELILNKGSEMNPFLEKFFYIEGIFSNNLRLSLSGSEVNHPDKAFNTVYNKIKLAVLAVTKADNLVLINIARAELSELLVNIPHTSLDEFITEFNSYKSINDLDGKMLEIYDQTIIEIINTAEGTQFKRNVIITATLQHPITGLINGVANTVNAAVIKDIKAPVNNLRDSDKIDSSDGSAPMSPILVILENNSLGDQRVGTNRKPIWDDLTSDLTSFLAKFASFGITNSVMSLSLKANSGHYNLFKKMHNIRWNSTIDITKNINQFEETMYDLAEVSRWFREAILQNQKLFYKNGLGNIVLIADFGKDKSGYFTMETILGKDPVKAYHYFNENSEHTTTKTELTHDIDSLYELFIVLGGINSVDAEGVSSEFSNLALTNFVINVGSKKKAQIESALDVILPLKDKFIAYAFNSSAVKNGAKNINNATAWSDDKALNTFLLNTQGLGILLNADHDVDNSELTEFSQVVAACAAYGKEYQSINEVYYSLAESAFLASQLELINILKYFKDYAQDPSKAKYLLYKIIGKLITKSKSNSELDLTELLKWEINKEFKINKDNSSKGLKIPFSDPSIYAQFITNITSVINAKSIKRKHPGSGYVMAPGYNVIMYFQMYEDGKYKKYLFEDILKRARVDYKNRLIQELEAYCIANNLDPNKYGERKRKIYNFDISTLLQETTGETIPYTSITTLDTTEFNKLLVDMFLNDKLNQEQIRDKSWFMPTDIVQVITPNNQIGETIDLSNMEDYYNFKNRQELEGIQFLLCVTKPNNLKPSLVRWLYIDPIDNMTKFMSIYDHPIIRESWNLDKSKKPKLAEILQVLDLLSEGKFELNGQLLDVISLEDTEAELVMGNMYKEIFLTGNNSISDIIELGEDFFKLKTVVPKIPVGFYNLAFIKNKGLHVLISFDNILETINTYEDPFDYTLENVNADNEIYNGINGIKIGKYINSSWKYSEGKVLDLNNNEINNSLYRLVLDSKGNVEKVMKRIDYVKRYKYTKSELVNGENQLINYTLYKIASIEDIERALGNLEDSYNQISAILNNIYSLDKFVDILVNTSIDMNPNILLTIANSLISFGRDTKVEKNKSIELTLKEINKLPKFLKHIIEVRKALLGNDFISEYGDIKDSYYALLQPYKLQYASFLNSLHFISSRIPAQSLLSFMPMTCVGWTADTLNTAYVSHILTYLQGSDYDIDKAYIMGQSFSDDGLYIGWSSLFDYSTEATIDASKTLPLPRKNKLIVSEGELYSIEAELNDIVNSQDEDKIRKLAKLIYKIDGNRGRYNYDTIDPNKEKIIKLILKHENYIISNKLLELAYKNVASANIRNVVHAIRNRDLAYSPITMKDLLDEADKSPKGAKTKLLNMMNPLTKYVMLNQNLIGKSVIGIAANGEKDWFNLTYYYHNILRTGNTKDKSYLKMSHSYSRIEGRATDRLLTIVVKHIPDLWNADPKLAEIIKAEFYEEYNGDMDDKLVDLLISQLLSAATDNAKELILAKINAGTNLAKYHLHLIMMGFNLKDVVSFMTSPVVELIDKYSRSDLYQNSQSSVSNAVKILNGDIDLSKLIVAPKVNMTAEEATEMAEIMAEAASELAENQLLEGLGGKVDKAYPWITSELGAIYLITEAKSLKDFVLKYIKAKTESSFSEDYMVTLSKYNLPITNNMNTNQVFKYINLLISDILSLIKNYNNSGKTYSMLDFKLDLNEFIRITEEANETSTLASVWLKLNLGIPLTDMELIARIKKMHSTVSSREDKMGIKKPSDSKKSKLITLLDDIETDNTNNKSLLLEYIKSYSNLQSLPIKGLSALEKLIIKAIKNIMSNNLELKLNEVLDILVDAVNSDLYGNFDLYKYLNNDMIEVPQDSKVTYNTRIGDVVSYRELSATYYNLIKSSWNILDLMNRIPHYRVNLDLLNYTLLTRHLFANKAKIVDLLISIGELSYSSLADKDYKNITLYADKVLITSYFLSRKNPVDLSKIKKTKVYNSDYKLVESEELYLDSLNGIDSLKLFVENEFYEWLKTNYPDNYLVKELVLSSNRGKSMLRTALNLFEIDLSLTNKLTFNKYLIGIKGLANELFDSNYSVADILMLYNLAVNGTKLGGKFMTGVFRDSVNNDSVIYDYYNFMGELDYESNFEHILPTKRDFLIAIAPTVYSMLALNFKTEPYVKVANVTLGYSIYKRYYDRAEKVWKYDIKKPESLLLLDHLGLTLSEINERIFNYTTNSLVVFPELHLRLKENQLFLEDNITSTDDLVSSLAQYIRLNRLLIYKLC